MENRKVEVPEYSNGWTEWGKFVLKELERLGDKLEDVNNSITELKVENGKQKIITILLGAIGGTVLTGIGALIINVISK